MVSRIFQYDIKADILCTWSVSDSRQSRNNWLGNGGTFVSAIRSWAPPEIDGEGHVNCQEGCRQSLLGGPEDAELESSS